MIDNSLSSLLVLYLYVCGLFCTFHYFLCNNDISLVRSSQEPWFFFSSREKTCLVTASVPVYLKWISVLKQNSSLGEVWCNLHLYINSAEIKCTDYVLSNNRRGYKNQLSSCPKYLLHTNKKSFCLPEQKIINYLAE